MFVEKLTRDDDNLLRVTSHRRGQRIECSDSSSCSTRTSSRSRQSRSLVSKLISGTVRLLTRRSE